MAWIAGVDGCPKGWFRVSWETESGDLHFRVIQEAKALLTEPPVPAIIGLDVPIGLPDANDRQCDQEARKILRAPRASSVFPVPIRPAIQAAARLEASRITEQHDGRKVGVQTWGIFHKIREVDDLMRSDAMARERIREVHPEVCFWAWAGGKPMAHSKKKGPGRQQRLALAEAWLGPGILERARGSHLKKHLADDDILDAIAALWTAHRIQAGTAQTLPAAPPIDSTDLPMQIVY